MPPLRIAVLGCGNIARRIHIPLLASMAGVKIVALADPDSRALAAAGAAAGRATRFADYREALEAVSPDAAVIASPSGMHASMAIAALEGGAAVYVEKPMATSAEDCAAVVATWNRTGKAGVCGFNYRFHPLVAEAKRLLDSGRVGQALHVQSVFSTAGGALPAWKRNRGEGGGALMDLGVHHIDLLHHFFGEDLEVVSAAVRSVVSEEDCATLELRLAGGLTAQCFFSLCAGEEHRWVIQGEKGTLRWDHYRSAGVEIRGTSARHARLRQALEAVRAFAGAADRSYEGSLGNFVAAVRGERRPAPDLNDGCRAVAVVLEAERKARAKSTAGRTNS